MYLFFETKTSVTMKGDIGVAESSDQGVTWKYIGIALEKEWHLSYPFIFEHDGEVPLLVPSFAGSLFFWGRSTHTITIFSGIHDA